MKSLTREELKALIKSGKPHRFIVSDAVLLALMEGYFVNDAWGVSRFDRAYLISDGDNPPVVSVRLVSAEPWW